MAVGDHSIDRELGRIEAQQNSQDQALIEIKQNIAALAIKVDTLVQAENSRSGGSKYLLLLLTGASLLGAILDRAISWLKVL